MTKNAADTLFRPLTTGDLPAPEDDARILYAGARSADGLPPPGRATGWVLVQPFKPWADPLAAYRVQAQWPHSGPHSGPHRGLHEGQDEESDEVARFEYAFVLGTKQADETRGFLAEAALRLTEGGWLVAAAANDEGGKRLAQECALLGFEGESASKNHARVVWAQKKAAAFHADTARDWAARAALRLCDATGFVSCPGLFSWDRIDPGSALLAQHLKDRLKGKGADFGCGTGYLSREIAAANPGLKGLACLDADARAVEACTRNMEGTGIPFACYQADLTNVRDLPAGMAGRLDWVVMNPPFHDGRLSASSIGAAFIQSAHAALHRGGMLYMVANSQLPYETVLDSRFGVVSKLDEKGGYKVYCAVRKD